MEMETKRIYIKSFKKELRRSSLRSYNRNLLKCIMGFLNVKELVKILMISHSFSAISLDFEIVTKYIEVNKIKINLADP